MYFAVLAQNFEDPSYLNLFDAKKSDLIAHFIYFGAYFILLFWNFLIKTTIIVIKKIIQWEKDEKILKDKESKNTNS